MGALKCLPGQLESHPLLRINVVGLHLRQREEFSVKTLEILEVSPAGPGLCDPLGQPGLVHELRPASLRQVGDGVATLHQRLPHLVGGVHITGEPGRQSDDRNIGDVAGAGPILVGVVCLQFGLTLDDHRRQRLDRRVPEGDRRGQGDPGQVFDVTGHRHRIARGQSEFDHRGGFVDGIGCLPGGVGHPVAQPRAHLGHRHVGTGRT